MIRFSIFVSSAGVSELMAARVRSVPDRSFPILIEIGAHSDRSEIEKSRFPF